jgi:hypothetical protein
VFLASQQHGSSRRNVFSRLAKSAVDDARAAGHDSGRSLGLSHGTGILVPELTREFAETLGTAYEKLHCRGSRKRSRAHRADRGTETLALRHPEPVSLINPAFISLTVFGLDAPMMS